MSGPTRKSVAQALLDQLAPPGSPFAPEFTGRRLRNPENSAAPGKPGLFVIKPSEKFNPSQQIELANRNFNFFAVIYTDVGADETAVPADIIDDLVDYVQAQLTPAGRDALLQSVTLGGLVQSVVIDGEAIFRPGDTTGKGETVIPIRVTVP